MDYKLKIYTLKNFFTNKNTIFIPSTDSESHEKIIEKLIKSKINKTDIDKLKELFDGLDIIPDEYIVKRINLDTYSVSELKNLLYIEYDVIPNQQLLFYNTTDDYEYRNRIIIDNLDHKSKKVNEVLGFYYKNTHGKRSF